MWLRYAALLVTPLALACSSSSHVFADGAGGGGGTDAAAGTGGKQGAPCKTDGARQCSGDVPQSCTNGVWVDHPACPSACTGAGVCACDSSARRCQGDTPQLCERGAWVDQTACNGATEACTGQGVCAAFKLLDAGIVTLGLPSSAAASGIKQHTLSATRRVCAEPYCITGEIR